MDNKVRSSTPCNASGPIPGAIILIVMLTVFASAVFASAAEEKIELMAMGDSTVEAMAIASPPTPLPGVAAHILDGPVPMTAVMLSNVPTSSWTYGCSATSAGMIFGYYDRTGCQHVFRAL